MQKYRINLGNGWTIENAEANDIIASDKEQNITSLKLSFGESEVIANRLIWLYEPFPVRDEWIEDCKELELFREKASFEVYLLKKSEWEQQEGFDGTLIEALEYIKENFKHE